ncbi:MAG: hypothetical protein HXY18_05475 [Bryobacteraceae bacterium]|nr:hypothetical protein [Bryobacteraceae bacterium]
MKVLRIEPDVVAVAVLSLLMLAPALLAAGPPRSGEPIRIHAASGGELELTPARSALEGLDNLSVWTAEFERRGERVWQRLSERMRVFEERFSRYSTVPPPSRSIYCETDSE